RVWEYLYATEAISQYMVVSNPANTTVTTVSSSTNGDSQIVFVTEASAGWTVGAYEDHWILVNTGTGTGQVAKVKGNTADTLELYTDYALATALAVADSGIAIRHAPDAEKVAVTVEITPLRGVAQVAFASADYGWFLKRGIGGVLCGAAVTINYSITSGDDTEGTAITGTTAKGPMDENYIGRVLVANSAADLAALVDINIL
ncbi:MAG: hypothetical protein Q8N14_03595, partial [Candidatus Omnitrophota bacterium]|nr:hypothetical protein [Candidatus Omnitrophota bacterium]